MKAWRLKQMTIQVGDDKIITGRRVKNFMQLLPKVVIPSLLFTALMKSTGL